LSNKTPVYIKTSIGKLRLSVKKEFDSDFKVFEFFENECPEYGATGIESRTGAAAAGPGPIP